MTRNMTLAAVLAMLPLTTTACGQSTQDTPSKAADAVVDAIELPDEAAASEAVEPAQAANKAIAGSTAPAVTTLDNNGAPVSFDTLSGSSGTVLVFTRSAEWCPYCQEQLIQLKDAKDPLASEGWSLAAISYDAPDITTAFAAKHDITYPLLSDTNSETIKRWGLLNAEMTEGTRYYGIPHPTIAYISADGTLLQIDTNTDYKVRPSPQDVIDAVTGLNTAMNGDGQ
jgi:peroxiredoxin